MNLKKGLENKQVSQEKINKFIYNFYLISCLERIIKEVQEKHSEEVKLNINPIKHSILENFINERVGYKYKKLYQTNFLENSIEVFGKSYYKLKRGPALIILIFLILALYTYDLLLFSYSVILLIIVIRRFPSLFVYSCKSLFHRRPVTLKERYEDMLETFSDIKYLLSLKYFRKR